MKKSQLEQLQDVVGAYLAGAQELPVIVRRSGDMESRIDEAVQTGLGLCLLVMHPLPASVHPNLPGPVYESVSVRVRVIENAFSNRTGTGILTAAERVSELLHLWSPHLKAWPTSLSLNPRSPWKLLHDRDVGTRTILEIELFAAGFSDED